MGTLRDGNRSASPLLRVIGLLIAISLTAALAGQDTPRCLPVPPNAREVQLSDDQAREMILRNFGPDIASRAIYRLTAMCARLDRHWEAYSSPR
jgi:hypothetical protein